MTDIPLNIKFVSFSGQHYIFDSESCEIIGVSEEIYDSIDQDVGYQISNGTRGCVDSENQSLSVEHGINEMKARGLLCNAPPTQCGSCGSVEVLGHVYSLSEYFENFRHILLVEITQECNLRCKYCIYGGHYPHSRKHATACSSQDFTSFIVDFLDKCIENACISFYGGEPLLEFQKIQEIVTITKKHAKDRNLTLQFGITTNGTLLDASIVHFLVENDFAVFVSMDGSKTDHDRYRVDKSGIGTFDRVIHNVNFFIEKYPAYKKRGFCLTISPTTSIQDVDQFLGKYVNHMGLQLSYVKDPTGRNKIDFLHDPPLFSEQCREHVACHQKNYFSHTTSLTSSMQKSMFNDWHDAFDEYAIEFLDTIFNDSSTAAQKYPLSYSMLMSRFKKIHKRKLLYRTQACSCIVKCLPGTIRLFLSSDGLLYPCERVWNSPIFQIGSVMNGIEGEKASYLSRIPGSLVECHRCIAKHLCPICLSMLYINQEGNIDKNLLDALCNRIRRRIVFELQIYVSILEKNPHAFDAITDNEENTPQWSKSIRLLG